MKIAFILFFFLLGFNTQAQLTNAEVYDFEIGDVFHTYYSHHTNNGGQAGTHTWDTILNKYFSTNADTLFYEIKRHTKTFVSGGGSGIVYPFKDTTIIKVHTNLGSSAQHYLPQNCTTCPVSNIYDTVGWCNSSTDIQSSFLGPNPFEPNTWESKLHKGLGGPYYSRTDYTQIVNGAPSWDYNLLYSNTAQHGPCGTPYSYASIEENEVIQFSIFPNPITSTLKIRTELHDYVYRIINIGGETLLTGNTNNSGEINVNFLKKGIYFIELKTVDQATRKRFIKL